MTIAGRLRMAVLASAFGMLAMGCQNQSASVFADSDRAAAQKGRFFDGESAYQTTQSRKQSMMSPFGFPTGAAQQ